MSSHVDEHAEAETAAGDNDLELEEAH